MSRIIRQIEIKYYEVKIKREKQQKGIKLMCSSKR